MEDSIRALKLSFTADVETLRTEFETKTRALVETYEARLAKLEEPVLPKLSDIKTLLATCSESSNEFPLIREPPVINEVPSPSLPKRHKCPYCEYKTNDNGDIGRHINDRHDTTRIYICPICGYCSKQSTNVKTHSCSKHSVSLVFQNPVRHRLMSKNGREVVFKVGKVCLTETQKKLWGERQVLELEDWEIVEKAMNYAPTYRN